MEAAQSDPIDQKFAPSPSKHAIGILRLAATLGLSAGVVFVLCWAGTFIAGASLTHAYIGLFTLAEPHSVQALVEGTCWSLAFGALAGAVIAICYNLFSGLQPR